MSVRCQSDVEHTEVRQSRAERRERPALVMVLAPILGLIIWTYIIYLIVG